MSRTLDTPAVQPDAVQHAITRFHFEVPHKRNDADTAMELQKLQIEVWYELITYDAAGLGIDSIVQKVPFDIWPPLFKAAAKDAYDKLHAHAESIGLIAGPGTDEPLE
jgi:hypothetical protein